MGAALNAGRDPQARARMLALVVPAVLLAGAFASQYVGRLVPCEMCWWQRWAHMAAFAFALAAFVAVAAGAGRGGVRLLVVLAGIAILASGGIGLFHAGVENHWWQGFTRCALPVSTGADFLADIMNTPLVRCDEAQWRLIGISLAGWNAIISIPFACLILWQTLLPRR